MSLPGACQEPIGSCQGAYGAYLSVAGCFQAGAQEMTSAFLAQARPGVVGQGLGR